MDGFIRHRDTAEATCRSFGDPACIPGGVPDVMGYHTGAEIPNYWTYAREFVLQDLMFEPVDSWSLAQHTCMMSAWSAVWPARSPMSCINQIEGPPPVHRSAAVPACTEVPPG
jgi:phospholipase C